MMFDNLHDRELRDSPPSSMEFAELDSEIRRMSIHADSLLQSIREVSGDAETYLSPANQATTSKLKLVGQTNRFTPIASRKPQEYLSYEDDDMTEEEERLESIAASIRESLAEPVEVPEMQNVLYSASTDSGVTLAEKSDEGDQSSEILLLGCSIVWAMVMILFLHAQYFLLNDKGQIHFLFGS